jgi:hypothetical protein
VNRTDTREKENITKDTKPETGKMINSFLSSSGEKKRIP